MADGMLSLAWNNHSSTFGHMLSTVRDSELYTDVTIACDGKFYPTHKLVLSTCSDYFYKIFERTPCKHPVIVIKDVVCKNMEALLNYMYAGVVSVCQSDLAQLIRAAELLEIKGLAVPDEPPSGTKRPVQTRDTSVDGSSSNPKKLRREEKRTLNQVEAPCIDSSIPSSQSSSKKDDDQGEHLSGNDIFNNKVNQRQSLSESRQERKESLTYSRKLEELGTENGQDHLNPEGQNQNEVASENAIKEERVETDESEAAEMDFKYESLVTDLVGSEEGTKEHSGASDTSFSHSLTAESYSAEAGPSGLQPWPVLRECGEASGISQGYSGGSLPLASHPGQQPHQMQQSPDESPLILNHPTIQAAPHTKSPHLPTCPIYQVTPTHSNSSLEENMLEYHSLTNPETPITYQLIAAATQRGKPKLVDSLGYGYNLKRQSKTATTWQCTVRNRTVKCPVTVKLVGDTFTRSNHHIHTADPGAATAF